MGSFYWNAWRAFAGAAGLAVVLALTGCGGGSVLGEPFGEAAPSCSRVTTLDEDWRAGCATRRNLAALAANPDDLYLARRETPRDAMRRDAVINNYAQSRANAAPQAAGAASPSIKTQADK